MDGPVIDFIASDAFVIGASFGFMFGSVLAYWFATLD